MSNIFHIEASGEKIQSIIRDKIGPAVDGELLSDAVIAMLAYSTLLMKPDITVDHLQKCVMETSGYLITMIEDSASGLMDTPTGQMN